MQSLILAGGFGSRLMPVVNDRPKIMAQIHGRPFLELLIAYLRKQHITDIILALGYLSDYIKNYFLDGRKYGANIRYSVEDYPRGTAGAIKNAATLLDKEFLVLNGDTFLEVDFQRLSDFHHTHKADLTIVISQKGEKRDRGIVQIDTDKRIVDFREVDEERGSKRTWSNTGVYLMNKKIFSFITKDEKVSLEKEIFPSILSKLAVFGCVTEKQYIDIGTPERYLQAQQLLKSI